MYMCGQKYTCMCMDKNIHVHVWAEMYMYVYGQKYTCTCVWVEMYMYNYMCWQTYMYRYMICVGKTIHTKIYMYTCMCRHCFSDVINDWQCKVHVW